jgi:hypothetical protein
VVIARLGTVSYYWTGYSSVATHLPHAQGTRPAPQHHSEEDHLEPLVVATVQAGAVCTLRAGLVKG